MWVSRNWYFGFRDQFYTDRGDGRATRERDRPAYRGSRLPHSGPHQQGTREKRPRWFVALFDYDPITMSPNPDACDEELPFSEGDTIKVIILKIYVKLTELYSRINYYAQQRIK